MDKFTFFFDKSSPFSNWYPCRFKIGKHNYVNSEQYFMEQKAIFFNDQESTAYIRLVKNPYAMKKRGRRVKGFDQQKWDNVSRDIMFRCVYEKFVQNSDLAAKLFQTGNTILAEASPFDKKWGIGLASTDHRAYNPDLWPGKNLLGCILMEVRSELVNKFC